MPVDGTPSDNGYVSVQTPSIKQRIDAAIYGFLAAVSKGLSTLPANPITEFVQGAWLTVRRTFFNQAPTLNPSQTTGQLSGAITGTLGAVDPEGDPMMYSVMQNPEDGTVSLNPDGTYTYTPGSDFEGRDVFIVAARDTASPAFNVLDPFGNGITYALVTVEQGTAPQVDYDFTFKQTTYWLRLYVQRWNQQAEIGLEYAAYSLADQVVPNQAVTLTFTATAQNVPGEFLASANSPLTSSNPGFYPTVVQSRIQTGSPSMTTTDGQPVPDGVVNVNFAYDWGYDGVVGPKQYNFESTATHELMHAFGFLSYIQSQGNNGGTNWTTFDQFITDNNGTHVINPITFAWNDAFDPNLTGGDEGLYFDGPNAADAFDEGPVPLYTPTKWKDGSSVSHLNDDYFDNATNPDSPFFIQLMNANDEPGPAGPNYLSSIEIGILEDLGYTMSAAALTTPSPV
ncbi:Ig-like domain-containing protein [Mycolicibacterium sphagni]|uniref:Ig-like domain-containing protein n=1 Tax=Mycolicibacterium sphagni TaxID=1786 RepID=UPI0021F34C96|nr:Ig-like domain-containing protein [Mycolicibacterium sphagni]MCV7174981.1 Ig-like domain-containing protein [Mycolicibacterium sphagni]